MHDEELAERVREHLAGTRNVEEKRMFGGLAFMVNGKLCVSVGESRIMCRIDPLVQAELIKRDGCHQMTMKGRKYKGYVRVDARVLRRKKDLAYWVGMALRFNDSAFPKM